MMRGCVVGVCVVLSHNDDARGVCCVVSQR